jgi:hypothetical protein
MALLCESRVGKAMGWEEKLALSLVWSEEQSNVKEEEQPSMLSIIPQSYLERI